ncbi:hypothetical protein K435DRAFT_781655 [Dendrothele bispora CBS 962.96]|uniref:Uncharacterized protein n=1 Tax=Dendrothele bispora (strain CBS 962.96) TaxID=1314807 RepID=A0A4S8LJT6_DENBC|nr:hypothetical protein K435DRAFT_781655 [Dendrothele bispora CBS 962.96]
MWLLQIWTCSRSPTADPRRICCLYFTRHIHYKEPASLQMLASRLATSSSPPKGPPATHCEHHLSNLAVALLSHEYLHPSHLRTPFLEGSFGGEVAQHARWLESLQRSGRLEDLTLTSGLVGSDEELVLYAKEDLLPEDRDEGSLERASSGAGHDLWYATTVVKP